MKTFLLPLFLIFCCSIDLSVSCAEQDQNGSPFKRIATEQEFENSMNRRLIKRTIKNLQGKADHLDKLFESKTIRQPMSSKEMLFQAQLLKDEISNEITTLSRTSPVILYAKYLQDVLDRQDEATKKWYTIKAITTLRQSITSNLTVCADAGKSLVSDTLQSKYQKTLDTIIKNELTESPYKYGIRSLKNLHLFKNSLEKKATELKKITERFVSAFKFSTQKNPTMIFQT
jgi:hypothetical protein